MSSLEFNHISIEAEGKRIVTDANLAISSGELHVILGPNGSGKSSLLNGVMGHPKFSLTEGSIVLDGEDITTLPTEKKAQKGIFLSLQYLPEIPGVTLTNFLHRSYKNQKGVDISILDFYKLAEAKAKSVGIDPMFLKRQVGAGLSGGEKKQAEILQLLVLEPKFAFLDEIDSGVDVDALKNVQEGITTLRKQGTGFVLVTHYDSLLDVITPDHVHVMQGGSITRSGGRELAAEIKEKGFTAL